MGEWLDGWVAGWVVGRIPVTSVATSVAKRDLSKRYFGKSALCQSLSCEKSDLQAKLSPVINTLIELVT